MVAVWAVGDSWLGGVEGRCVRIDSHGGGIESVMNPISCGTNVGTSRVLQTGYANSLVSVTSL